MALRRINLAEPTPAADYPVPEPKRADAPIPAPEPGEDLVDFFERVAPLVARQQAGAALAGDGKASRWLLERTSATRDRLSTPLEVDHEDLSSAEGVSRTMRKLTVLALRGELGLGEARKATDLVKESSESMFAEEIATLRDAIENAKRYSHRSLNAVNAEFVSRGAITAEEVDAGLLLEAPRTIDATPLPADPLDDDPPAPVPAWGRFQKASGA